MSGTYSNAEGVTYAYRSSRLLGAGSLVVSGPDLETTTYTIDQEIGATSSVQTGNGATSVGAIFGIAQYFDVPTVTQTYTIQSGLFGSVIIHVGGTATIDNDVSAPISLAVDVDGGEATYNAAASAANALTVAIDDQGSFTFAGTVSTSRGAPAVSFGNGGGTLVFGNPTGSVWPASITINQFSTKGRDFIDDKSLSFADVTSYRISGEPGGQAITFYDGAAADLSISVSGSALHTGTFATGQSGGALSLSSDKAGDLLFTLNTCFLAGSAIATPYGETAIEHLGEGDLVLVREGAQTISRPVLWVGRRRIDLSGSACPAEAYPVRILAQAFGEGVPGRDLLLTAEHCILANGVLIPARMLVNGSSIRIDRSIPRYEYFHIELEQHGILIANGLETESYMDTGNRGAFANSPVVSLLPDRGTSEAHDRWAFDAAAPLAVDRATVEPIWRRLAERAVLLGLPLPPAVALTEQPDFRLRTDSGVLIRPILSDGAVHAFVVPGGARSLRMLSRASSPCETIGPFVDDRRPLGLSIGRIGVGIGRRRRPFVEHLQASALGGWHAIEPGACSRWTNGDAVLPVDLSDGEPAFLDIEVCQAGPYVETAEDGLAADTIRRRRAS